MFAPEQHFGKNNLLYSHELKVHFTHLQCSEYVPTNLNMFVNMPNWTLNKGWKGISLNVQPET